MTITQKAFEALKSQQDWEDEQHVDDCDSKLEALAEHGVLDEDAEGALGFISRAYYSGDVLGETGGYNVYLRKGDEGQPVLEIACGNYEGMFDYYPLEVI